ncbi:glycosyltransferase family 2 protein [Tamlana sp. 62-3]|uniref:Glycosyltransferase family 2 protein n=1 Tax=Neotamlana sargassicola TaxID=2883125 RepID=A0A9X1IA32_9FLAO|nr:glycosyltransferase family A protein [Tamlana sargassicola]MCB4808891.1 glycosyltransferase family 2 protein [Tamlana sargassicola]
MLSVLIPTYNCNITSLVHKIHKQASELNVVFEIICIDDCSTTKSISEANQNISNLKNTNYTILDKNVGRSAIRNILAKQATYNLLLFIDAGTMPKNTDFIKSYLKVKNHAVTSGGMTCLATPPNKPYKLRWLYTKKREHKTLCSSNFMIKKDVILAHPFDETITSYGYEDVLFFKNLEKHDFKTHFFNNPVVHHADDDTSTFLNKTDKALNNLMMLYNEKKIFPHQVKLLKLYLSLKTLKLNGLIYLIFKIVKPIVKINLNSNNPSILLFDFYRISYLCRH